MSHFFQRKPPRRCPRANLGGTILAVIRLENGRQLTSRVQQLSITGGLLDHVAYLEERTWAELTIYLSSGPVRTTAEMMFPMRAPLSYRQPFRFISVGTEELHAVDREVTEWLKQSARRGPGDSGSGVARYDLET